MVRFLQRQKAVADGQVVAFYATPSVLSEPDGPEVPENSANELSSNTHARTPSDSESERSVDTAHTTSKGEDEGTQERRPVVYCLGGGVTERVESRRFGVNVLGISHCLWKPNAS